MLLSLAIDPAAVAASRDRDPAMDEAEFLGFYRDTAPRLHAFLRRCFGDAAKQPNHFSGDERANLL